MNREIKFRAIHKGAIIHGYPYKTCAGQWWMTTPDGQKRIKPDTLMEYTGLKDKNGKPIYEGDIVRYKEFERFREGESVHVSVVKYYCEPNSRVGFEPMVWHTKVEDGYYNSELEDYEVIGNIYENPELLEGK